MNEINLWDETIADLKYRNKTWDDVVWVGNINTKIPKYRFKEIAKKYNYDNSYGGTEVPESLLIVGKDWWLERHEYDGSEWWVFKKYPEQPENTIIPIDLYDIEK